MSHKQFLTHLRRIGKYMMIVGAFGFCATFIASLLAGVSLSPIPWSILTITGMGIYPGGYKE